MPGRLQFFFLDSRWQRSVSIFSFILSFSLIYSCILVSESTQVLFGVFFRYCLCVNCSVLIFLQILLISMIQKIICNSFNAFSKFLMFSLTHFSSVSHFYTPWKRQKTFGFLTFSGGMEMWHWTKMG